VVVVGAAAGVGIAIGAGIATIAYLGKRLGQKSRAAQDVAQLHDNIIEMKRHLEFIDQGGEKLILPYQW